MLKLSLSKVYEVKAATGERVGLQFRSFGDTIHNYRELCMVSRNSDSFRRWPRLLDAVAPATLTDDRRARIG